MISPKKARLHYAWIVVAVTFFVLLVVAGVRTIPSVVIKPLEAEFGWNRSTISSAASISLIFYAIGGPFAGALVGRYGPRRVMIAGLLTITLGLVPLAQINQIWQLYWWWGVIVGIGTGMISNVIAATIASRWFNQHRGTVQGLLVASVALGQLIFLPLMVSLTEVFTWHTMIQVVAVAVASVLIPTLLWMRDQPSDVGQTPVGEADATQTATDLRSTPLREAIRTTDFWLLAGSFFICGYTTNGLIGTHLLPHTVEHGFVEVQTSYALGLMGLFNIFGTLASGWLSDRYDNRVLLATYYGLRGLSLLALPWITEMQGLLVFAVIYGLDWVATVPPTVNLTAQRFGRGSLGTIYGWIFFSHMIGAALAAQAGGIFRDLLGDYHLIFLSAALMGVVAAGLSLRINPKFRPAVAEVSQ